MIVQYVVVTRQIGRRRRSAAPSEVRMRNTCEVELENRNADTCPSDIRQRTTVKTRPLWSRRVFRIPDPKRRQKSIPTFWKAPTASQNTRSMVGSLKQTWVLVNFWALFECFRLVRL